MATSKLPQPSGGPMPKGPARSGGQRPLAALLLGLLVVGCGLYYLLYGLPFVSRTPTPSPQQSTARFTRIEGAVQVKALGTLDWRDGDGRMGLGAGDFVKTGPGSVAEITFFDGTVVHVRPESLITIEAPTQAARVAWNITSGGVDLRTSQGGAGGGAKVTTRTVTGTVGGSSRADIQVEESGASQFRVYEGSGRIETRSGQSIPLSSSEGLRVDASGVAGAKLALPPMPVLLSPAHQATLAFPDPAQATTVLEWRAVADAFAYNVVMDQSALFKQPLVSQKGVRNPRVEVRGLDLGDYYWRVSALGKNGMEGSFSDFSKLTISRSVAQAKPPTLAVRSVVVHDNIVQIKGRTDPGASVTVNGQRLEVMADGSFNDFVALEVGNQVVLLRATGLDSGVAEKRIPVKVSEN
jgi:hypothetical protein